MIGLKKLVLASAVGTLLAMSSAGHAADCKNVRFQFVNASQVADTPVQVKIKNVRITGNDGTWTEDLKNKRIDGGASWTSGKRRMNKLDSGAVGTFRVSYQKRRIGPGWDDVSQSFPDHGGRCRDGQTYSFRLTR